MADVDKIIKQKHDKDLDIGKIVNPPLKNLVVDIKLEKSMKENSQSNLIDIAKNDIRPKFRLEAVMQINDDSILAEIAKNTLYRDVCSKAVELIDDELFLVDVAKNASYNSIRLEAVRQINDKLLLDDISKDTSSISISLEAINLKKNLQNKRTGRYGGKFKIIVHEVKIHRNNISNTFKELKQQC